MSPNKVNEAALLGAACALGRVQRLPAREWAVISALDAGGVSANVPTLVRSLARSGALRPSGRGWEAGYDIEVDWAQRSYAELDPNLHHRAEDVAAQLVAMVTIWSKNAVVSDDSRVGTSTSSVTRRHEVTYA